MTIRIELDSVKVWRNKREFRPMNRASCGNIAVKGDGPLIPKLCRAVLANGSDPKADVMVYRNGTLCFVPTPLEVWASGKAGKGEQPEHLRK